MALSLIFKAIMPLGILLKAVKGVDYDSDELYKSQLHAAFIKGINLDITNNPSLKGGVEGNNAGVFTPNEANYALVPLQLPEGDNYCIGYKEVLDLNEGYVFVFNSRQNHCIYRINGHDSSCQMVKIDHDFNFQLDPKYFIPDIRCTVQSYCVFNAATGQTERRKEMYFTDNFNPMRFLNIEDCIATNGFDQAKFPFFNYFKSYKEYLINNGLPYSFKCIGIKPLPTTEADKVLDNRINDKAIKFRTKEIDVWGRESEHSVISAPYRNSTGGCLSTGQARCLELIIFAGPPTIAKIQVEMSICSANAQDISVESDWSIIEVVDKYDQSSQALQWWERPINPDLKYDAATNTFKYTFCNDKGDIPIPISQTNRRFNPVPITTGCVFPVNKSIGVANNRKKYPQLPNQVLKNLSFSVEKPSTDNQKSCIPKPVNITVYGLLYCEQEKKPVELHEDQGDILFGADKAEFVIEAGQVLPKGQQGIIGYFAGTNEYAISKQYQLDLRTGEMKEVGMEYLKGIGFFERHFYAPVQKWEFKNVTPGNRIFRVASHKASPTDDYQKTSTNVYGLTSIKNNSELGKLRDTDVQEILIDACNGDVDLKDDPILICDLTRDDGRITNSVTGYLYEDEVSKYPIERARIESTEFAVHQTITDHNGYFWSVNRKKDWRIKLYGTKNGQVNQFLAESQETYDAPGARYRHNVLYVYKNTVEYPAKDRVIIKGKVELCDSVSGVGGIGVLVTGGQPAVTDSNGNYRLVVHDNGNGSISSRTVMITQSGKCAISTCDGKCNYCLSKIQVSIPRPPSTNRELQQATYKVSVPSQNLQGPQNGGRYELGIVAFDWLGRTIGVENVESHFIDIPAIQETGIYGFSKIKYKFKPNTIFPEHVRNITFVISKNLNWDDFVTWYADKIELIDNSGNVNKVSPTQIKVYYRGMTEYGIRNNFSTNTNWQFLDEDEKLITGDRVEFVANGDGKIFTTRTTSIVKADTQGSFFTIEYTDQLRGLIDGAMLKIMRRRRSEAIKTYYEICAEIELVNRQVPAAKQEGYLDYYDSYMVNRQIPVPVYREDGTQDETKTIVRNLAFPFEHPSPSDFWGDHCTSRGRGFTKDPYANIQCLSTEIGLSKELVNDGLINGLSYFDDADFNLFDKQEWGGITAVIPVVGALLVICEQNNFVVAFDDDSVKVSPSGQVVAIPANKRFGRPEKKVGYKYGCQPSDINTIAHFMGIVTFLDATKSAWVMHNFVQGQDMSLLGCSGWIKDKVKHVMEYNKNNSDTKKYFHACFDPSTQQVLLTSFKMPVFKNTMAKLTIEDYVNNTREDNLELNETVSINPFEQVFKGQLHYTPEYFGNLIGSNEDKQFFSFKDALPYAHHSKYNSGKGKRLNYFGVQCDWIYEVVYNVAPEIVKRYMCITANISGQKVFCDRILTDSGQRSRLLLDAWEFREHQQVASLRFDLNTFKDPNSASLSDASKLIFEGNTLYGKWLKARFVGKPDQSGRYFEFDGVRIAVVGSENSSLTQ